MRLSAPAIVLSLCALITTATPVPEPLSPRGPPGFDPSKVKIQDIVAGGSGCTKDTVQFVPNNDWTVVDVIYSNFIAQIGPGVPFVERRKNCNLNFKIHYPQGFALELYRTDYYGYYDLEYKVEGKLQARYWFAGSTGPVLPICNWVGKAANDYHCVKELLGVSIVKSPCGTSANLNINSEVILNNDKNPNGKGIITQDVSEQKVKTLLSFRWTWCH